MSVPNQKTVKLAPRTKRDSEHLYSMNNLDALQMAMKTLNGSGLKLWLYMNKNQDGYRFELSRVDCAKWGIKKDSYYKAVEELIQKGYLVQDHYGSSLFWFHEKESEKPQRNNTNNTNNKEIIKNTTLDDDNADGIIVNCGDATIQSESYEKQMERWFGKFKNEKTCEDPNLFINKYY